MSSYTPQLVGAGELQKNASLVIKKVSGSKQESFIVNRNTPVIVMMSLERYAELRAKEEHELKIFSQVPIATIKEEFTKTGAYSSQFIEDLEAGLKKSTAYSKKK